MTEKELILAALCDERTRILHQVKAMTHKVEGLDLAIDIVERVMRESRTRVADHSILKPATAP